jgi:hypothetical protein
MEVKSHENALVQIPSTRRKLRIWVGGASIVLIILVSLVVALVYILDSYSDDDCSSSKYWAEISVSDINEHVNITLRKVS